MTRTLGSLTEYPKVHDPSQKAPLSSQTCRLVYFPDSWCMHIQCVDQEGTCNAAFNVSGGDVDCINVDKISESFHCNELAAP